MLEDKLTHNEQFLLKRLLRSSSKSSYEDLKQAIKDVNEFYQLTSQEMEEYLKNQMNDVYNYLQGKGIYGFKEDIIEKESPMDIEELIDLIISCGSVPSEGESFFNREEILDIEKYASKHSDTKLEKKIRKILKNKENK